MNKTKEAKIEPVEQLEKEEKVAQLPKWFLKEYKTELDEPPEPNRFWVTMEHALDLFEEGIKIGERKAFYKQERPMSKKTLKELEDISKRKVKFYDIKDNMIFVKKAPCVILLEPLFQEREQKKAKEIFKWIEYIIDFDGEFVKEDFEKLKAKHGVEE